jgi:hypothetical protein
MIDLTLRNSMRPGTPEFEKANADMSLLENQGYIITHVASMTVLNANPRAKHPDFPLQNQDIGPRYFDCVMSGPETEVVFGVWPNPPVGPVFRRGRLDTIGTGRGQYRGVVAILTDGTVIVDRADGSEQADLTSRFSSPENPLVQLMGGGGLLIENGRRVGTIDMKRKQLYGGNPGGLRSLSMLNGTHLFVGIRRGKAYAGITFGRSALSMQDDFVAAEFGTLVKFSSGGTVFFDDGEIIVQGQSAVGFGIKARR